MVEKLLLDTNILYYWTGTYNINKYDIKAIDKAMINREIFISELSFIEALLKFKNEKEKTDRLYRFMAEKTIGIIPYFNSENTLLSNELNEIIDDYKKWEKYVKIASEKRSVLQSNYIAWFLANVNSILAGYLCNKIEIDNINFSKFYNQFEPFFKAICEKDGETVKTLKTILEKYPAKKDNECLQSEIRKIFYGITIGMIYILSCSKHNIVCTDLVSPHISLSDEIVEQIFDDFFSEELTDIIFTLAEHEIQKNNNLLDDSTLISLFNKKEFDIIQIVDAYKSSLTKDTGKFLSNYMAQWIEKYISTIKIELNDIIDSQLLRFMDQGYILLTDDKKILKIIEITDKDMSDKISSIKNTRTTNTTEKK